MVYTVHPWVYPAHPMVSTAAPVLHGTAAVCSDEALGSEREISLGESLFSGLISHSCEGWWELCAWVLPAS